MHTNYVGSVAVTQAMLLLLQGAGKAQIINVSSELGSVSLHNGQIWKYAQVKLLAASVLTVTNWAICHRWYQTKRYFTLVSFADTLTFASRLRSALLFRQYPWSFCRSEIKSPHSNY